MSAVKLPLTTLPGSSPTDPLALEITNKSVIAAHMKRGGMRWSRKGISRMAALRSAQLSNRPLVDFHETRLTALQQI